MKVIDGDEPKVEYIKDMRKLNDPFDKEFMDRKEMLDLINKSYFSDYRTLIEEAREKFAKPDADYLVFQEYVVENYPQLRKYKFYTGFLNLLEDVIKQNKIAT
jgi:hypothetical protein